MAKYPLPSEIAKAIILPAPSYTMMLACATGSPLLFLTIPLAWRISPQPWRRRRQGEDDAQRSVHDFISDTCRGVMVLTENVVVPSRLSCRLFMILAIFCAFCSSRAAYSLSLSPCILICRVERARGLSSSATSSECRYPRRRKRH